MEMIISKNELNQGNLQDIIKNRKINDEMIHENKMIIKERRKSMADKVRDLRSALDLLKTMEGQYIETDVEVDPMAELAGVYRYVGAGGTVKRPTRRTSYGI